MIALTEKNIEFIYNDIREKGLTMPGLLDEMVDHICCMIEPELLKGISFEAAYNGFVNTLENSTFKNIQHQTLLSTNLKFQNMKKLMVVLGTLSALFLSAGSILKIFHLPPAGFLLLMGGVTTVLGFLPLFFYTSYKEQTERKSILLSITGYLTLSFLTMGVLFKVQHWPGAAIALLTGQFLLILLFLPLYLVSVFRKANDVKTNVLSVLLIVIIGIGVILMSYATRISREIVNKYDNINTNAIEVAKVFAHHNDSLVKILQEEEHSIELKSRIDEIEILASGINQQIEFIKSEMGNYVNGFENNKYKDNYKAFSKVMHENNNAIKLRKDFMKFKNTMLQLPKNELQKQTINALLDFDMFTGNMYERGFKRTSLIEALAMLSGMQKNIEIAKFEILSSLE